MSAHRDLLLSIEETLSLLEKTRDADPKGPVPAEPLPSLLKDCEAACAALDAVEPEPIRTIHHFACTGGTILSRCIEAMPNTVLLSEIDPLSTIPLRKASFAPLDILQQSQTGLRPLDDTGVTETFLAGLTAMHEAHLRTGRRLVIRDHTHSHYCTETDPAARPTIHALLRDRFALRSLVTVRHPLDSFISLEKNGWVMFTPKTLEEYCRRYLLFLNAYDDTPVLRYEDFVNDPDHFSKKIAETLALPFTDHWRQILPVISVTGDSGRSGDEIAPRARQDVSSDLLRASQESAHYKLLCVRLGYNDAATGDPLVMTPDSSPPNETASTSTILQ